MQNLFIYVSKKANKMSAERRQFGVRTARTFNQERDVRGDDGLWGRTPSAEDIGPITQEFVGYDKAYGFDFEALDKGDLSFCVDALRQARYEHLISLLDRKVETAFLRDVKKTLPQVLSEVEVPAYQRFNDETLVAKQMTWDQLNEERDAMRRKIRKARVRVSDELWEDIGSMGRGKGKLSYRELTVGELDEIGRRVELETALRKAEKKLTRKTRESGFRVPLRIIPPEKLWGLCGEDDLGKLQLTDIGKVITTLYRCPYRFPELSLFLIGGIARKALGIKPKAKTREQLSVYSHMIRHVWHILKHPEKAEIKLPPADIDFLAVAGTGQFDLEEAKRVLYRNVFEKSSGGKIDVKQSSQRSDLGKLDMGTRRFARFDEEAPPGKIRTIEEEFLLAELFCPPFEGKYGPENGLLPYAMASSRSMDVSILLIPHYHEQEKSLLLWGVALDFFDGLQDARREHRVHWQGHSYLPSYYPFPELVFSMKSLADMFWRWRYLFRTLPWEDRIPIMHSVLRDRLTAEQLESGTIKNFLARETQEYITNDIIYFLARKAREKSDGWGTERQRAKMAIAFVKEDLPLAFNGDPLATTIRCLPASETDAEIDTEESPMYSWGVFDKKGFFPELGKFLEEKVSAEDGRRAKRKKLLLERMKKCPHGGAVSVEKSGWQEFLDFLFEQTGYDANKIESARKVARLLTPIVYPWKWENFVQECLLKLKDERFDNVFVRATHRERILPILEKTDLPLTAVEIARRINIRLAWNASPSAIGYALKKMEEAGEVRRFGGTRKTYADGQPIRQGGGGSRNWWIGADRYPEFENDIRFMSPRQKILALLSEEGLNASQLEAATGLCNTTCTGALRLLVSKGRVHKVREKRPGDSQAISYYYKAVEESEESI